MITTRLLAAALLFCTVASPRAEATGLGPPGRATFSISTSEGREILVPRYLAVVREDRPWREPERESLIVAGRRPPTWSLPPGRYRVVCSAEGYGLATGNLEITPQRDVEHVCRLPRRVEVSGRVLRADGSGPISGATVGRDLLFFEPPVWSDLATDHLSPSLVAVTDAEGSFRLSVVPETRELLWLEADGFAPDYYPGLLVPAGGGDLGDFHLHAGVSLDATVEIPAGFPRYRYHLELRSEDLVWPAGDTREGVSYHRQRLTRRIWQRPLGKLGSARAHWASLPAGRHEVWLKGPSRGDHHDLPVLLGTVDAAAGQALSLTADVPAMAGIDAPPAPAASGGDLRLVIPAFPGELDELEVMRFEEERVIPVEGAWQLASGGHLLTLAEGCRAGAVYVLRGSGYISAPISVRRAPCLETGHLDLFPEAVVRGRLRAPVGDHQPAAGKLAVRRCNEPRPGSGAIGAYPFLIAQESGDFELSVPSGCADLSLHAGDYAPLSWSSLAVEPGSSNDLGASRLKRGASLLVRVIHEADGMPAAGAQVDLIADDQIEHAVRASLNGKPVEPVSSATTDVRGWTRMVGAPAGVFTLRVAQDGGVPSFSNAFRLDVGEEAMLEDVTLAEPGSLSVRVSGDSHQLAGIERLVLLGETDMASCGWKRAFSIPLETRSGAGVEVGPIPSGSWRLSLEQVEVSGVVNRVSSREVHLPSGGWQEVELEIDQEVYRGLLSFRGQPLAGTLKLRPAETAASRGGGRPRIAAADEEGAFHLPLGARGRYDVQVSAEDPKVDTTLAGVLFDDPEELVRIVVPDGRISGFVEDAEGRAVPAATVVAARMDGPRQRDEDATGEFLRHRGVTVTASDDGHFLLAGLDAGEWTLRASHEGRRSRTETFRLASDEPRNGVRLEIAKGAELGGRISVDGQPVAGARLLATSVSSASMTFAVPAMESAADGTFSTELSEADAPINLVVEAAGLPTTVFQVTAQTDLDLRLAPNGGRLTLRVDKNAVAGKNPGHLLLIDDRGAFVTLSHLTRTRSSTDLATGRGELVLPNLAAGSWSLVSLRSTTDIQFLLSGGASILPAIATFSLVPGQSLDVMLDL